MRFDAPFREEPQGGTRVGAFSDSEDLNLHDRG
jgi:hypothetical protein